MLLLMIPTQITDQDSLIKIDDVQLSSVNSRDTICLGDGFLGIITEAFPCIKSLRLSNFRMVNNRYSNTTFDLSGAKHLEHIYLELSETQVFRASSIFIEVEFSEEFSVLYTLSRRYKEYGFQSTPVKYLHSYNRIISHNTAVLNFQCQKIDKMHFQITIYVKDRSHKFKVVFDKELCKIPLM